MNLRIKQKCIEIFSIATLCLGVLPSCKEESQDSSAENFVFKGQTCMPKEKEYKPIRLTRYQIEGPRGFFNTASADLDNDGWLSITEQKCVDDYWNGNRFSEYCAEASTSCTE
jgi:hypothetical protein